MSAHNPSAMVRPHVGQAQRCSFTLLRGVFGTLLTLGLTSGCEEKVVPRHTVRITVTQDASGPMPGTVITVEGKAVGQTNESGIWEGKKTAPDGTRIQGSLQCPEGYLADQPNFELVLTRIEGLSGGAAPIVYNADCRPMQRESVLLVRTGFPEIGVEVDGKLLATTDLDGFAHIHLRRAPNTKVSVKLDTSKNPKLQPVNPSRPFELADADEVVVYSQSFSKPAPPPKPRKRIRRKKQEVKKHVPTRL